MYNHFEFRAQTVEIDYFEYQMGMKKNHESIV